MEPDSRLDRDVYFMTIALVVSLRSTCLRGQVGAVLVRDNRILSTGYNGAPRGFAHCTPKTCSPLIPHCRATVHAELNSILAAAYQGVRVAGATLYTTTEPCDDCWFALINAGVERVFYWKTYFRETEPSRFDRRGMELFQIKPSPIIWSDDSLELDEEPTLIPQDVVARVGDSLFRCECGCNVFRHPVNRPQVYVCNACDRWYEGEPLEDHDERQPQQ